MDNDPILEQMLVAFFAEGDDPDPAREFFRSNMREALAVAREGILDEAATRIDHSICDVAIDADMFMQLRDFFAERIRSLASQEQPK